MRAGTVHMAHARARGDGAGGGAAAQCAGHAHVLGLLGWARAAPPSSAPGRAEGWSSLALVLERAQSGG